MSTLMGILELPELEVPTGCKQLTELIPLPISECQPCVSSIKDYQNNLASSPHLGVKKMPEADGTSSESQMQEKIHNLQLL
jgi:hypothetical protein